MNNNYHKMTAEDAERIKNYIYNSNKEETINHEHSQDDGRKL